MSEVKNEGLEIGYSDGRKSPSDAVLWPLDEFLRCTALSAAIRTNLEDS